ncbi:hypothetical protein CANARDRAFT_27295 [[Candida] arabinofermentans NRRL YB-2248]|uniref:Uncharacterized protein n=1 Tax=[Candida] arabinofermentans NRRL YB-2248 TaxID=983967 RepID=A0A1E4T5B7_9ASCO|nr:hypothetical protein CANARDRAFT_27295 [[Candida] arabinofermentans NRRL YB-2248]
MDDQLNQESVYQEFHNYDFQSDEQYQNGLVEVMKQYLMIQSETDEKIRKDLDESKFDFDKISAPVKTQLQTQAKVFFFCSKTGNILDLEDYEKWAKTYEEKKTLKAAEVENTDSTDGPPYSSNYEELVDLIVNNKPIPGIKQIPDIVLDPSKASKATLTERKKPWEVEKPSETSKDSQVEERA